ncbi:MAG: plasmid mobilization relaxosome protein MobC [Proteobacteria bacterium]|nr:plasmid mobilization relaxosome protein MobC [Pseudomonadota bacterium]
MAMFSVRVSDDAAQRFDAAAMAFGGRSALLRRLIDAACGPAGGAPCAGPIPRPLRLMVRLRAEDAAAVAAEARAMGLRPSTWVAALVSHRVRGRPRFRPPEEDALLAIHSEVHRIGVNVNQIARALNTAILEGQVLDLELSYLDALRGELRAHLASLREAFEGNLAYWQGDP